MRIKMDGEYVNSHGRLELPDNLYFEVRKFGDDYYDVNLKNKTTGENFGYSLATGLKSMKDSALLVYRVKKMTGITEIKEVDET